MTIKNMKSIAERVESSCRHDDLSFEHHSIVPSLSPEMQKAFLQKAADENLTVKEFREEVKQFKNQNLRISDNKGLISPVLLP